jgi:hypothetical protein
MARPRKYTNEQMIAALKETKGMVYLAAERMGCDPSTIFDRARISPVVRKAIGTERGKVVDTSELKLFQAIMRDEPWAITLALKTIGKDRGYVERQEHDHTGELQLEIIEEIIDDCEPAAAPQNGAAGATNGTPPPGAGRLPS